MRILGIDPGLGTTGYGIIEAPSAGIASPSNHRTFRLIEAGIIKTRANTPIQARLKKIFDAIVEIIEEHKPGVLVLEKIYSHYKHPTTAILMGHARGVVCLACGVRGIRLVSYPSTKIKKMITGNGHASKLQVQRMVQDILKLKYPPEPVDVSDALAMAMSYCYMEKMK